jgi:hypothetical protein
MRRGAGVGAAGTMRTQAGVEGVVTGNHKMDPLFLKAVTELGTRARSRALGSRGTVCVQYFCDWYRVF